MYKDKLGRQYGFACPKGSTGPKGNDGFGPSTHIFVPSYGSMTPEEYFKFRTEGVVKRKCSDGYIIHFPKDFDSYNFKVFNSEQLDTKVKKLEAFLTNKDKLKDLKFKQIQLLHKQLSGMKTYLEALTERIKNL